MKNVVVFTALAGLASAAVAGAPSGTLSIIPSTMTVDSSATTSFTLAVYGDANFGTHLFGGAFALDATGGEGIVTGMSYTSATWAEGGLNDRGAGADGDYDGIVFGQIILGPPFNIPPAAESALGGGGVFIGSFQVEIAANSEGTINWQAIADSISTFALEVYDENQGLPGVRIANDDFTGFGSASVNVVIPAPSSMALLGLGGLVAGRRRR